MNVLERLAARRLLASVTNESVNALAKGTGAYLGIDPTADGLHVGHLAGVLALRELQKSGLRPIALVGGATGMIGDPSGRNSERELLSEERVSENVAGLKNDLEKLLDFETGKDSAVLVNNADWFQKMSSLDFLRDIGKHFRVSTMLSRESVKSRLESEDNQGGLSFTEFSYQLLQGYDFLHLYRTMNCRVQLGGSDQWGNIVSGIDLIKRVEHGQDAHGITIPLLTTSTGQKFGKSMGNAVWLSPAKTSDYSFYQFFLRVEDNDVENLLFKLTELESEEISSVMTEHKENEHLRGAQKRLAEELMLRVRGSDRLRLAKRASEALFGSSLDDLSAEDLLSIAKSGDVPLESVPVSDLDGKFVTDLAHHVGLVKSKAEAKRLASSNGLYINNRRVETANEKVDLSRDSIEKRVILLRAGKRNYMMVQLI